MPAQSNTLVIKEQHLTDRNTGIWEILLLMCKRFLNKWKTLKQVSLDYHGWGKSQGKRTWPLINHHKYGNKSITEAMREA